MAAQITHIVLTAKVFDKLFSNRNKQEFFIGATFPDIRYYKKLDRNTTHTNTVTLQDVYDAESSFMAGVKFHSLLDNHREAYMLGSGIYEKMSGVNYSNASLKIFEDFYFYNRLDGWDEYIRYFDSVLDEETSFGYGLTQEDVKNWHIILQDYFRQSPTGASSRKFLKDIDLPDELIEETITNVEDMRSNRDVLDVVGEFYDRFEEIITCHCER